MSESNLTIQVARRERADYGIDAPDVVRLLVIGGAAGIIAGILLYVLLRPIQPRLAVTVLNGGVWGGLGCLASASSMVWSSKVGKLRGRDRLIESIPWRGDETVLDVGCGRGLLLVAAAKRLTTGKVMGVDIWRGEDQSGNGPDATWENARIEGVADRVEVKDGDARHLPFEDHTFDVVISSLALHNIHGKAGRKQAVREIVRVLKPGGHVAILDVARTDEYARVLRENGMSDVRPSAPQFIFSPLACIVMATKSAVFRQPLRRRHEL